MGGTEKMDSRELGLVLTEILLEAKDLHYGLWDGDLALSIGNARIAQQRYTDMILSALPRIENPAVPVRILDIGCGGGHMMMQMLDRGYHVDGVSPSPGLSRRVRERLAPYSREKTSLFEYEFQQLPSDLCRNQYDVALFSESFQYIPLHLVFDKLEHLLKPGGLVIISDVFSSPADGDGGPGDKSIRGGHHIKKFYEQVEKVPFTIQTDEDITRRVSPNLELVNDLLMNKVKPAGLVLGQYLRGRYFLVVGVLMLLKPFFRKKLEKIRFKYFSGHRSKEVFERYKMYRFIRLQYTKTTQVEDRFRK